MPRFSFLGRRRGRVDEACETRRNLTSWMVKVIFAWHERQTWMGVSPRTEIMPGGTGKVELHDEHVGWKTDGSMSVTVQPVTSIVPARILLACKA